MCPGSRAIFTPGKLATASRARGSDLAGRHVRGTGLRAASSAANRKVNHFCSSLSIRDRATSRLRPESDRRSRRACNRPPGASARTHRASSFPDIFPRPANRAVWPSGLMFGAAADRRTRDSRRAMHARASAETGKEGMITIWISKYLTRCSRDADDSLPGRHRRRAGAKRGHRAAARS